ncbi:MAG TPA: hypothetical protein VH498_00640 [Candidatus Dormibacteraeota bacterium]|nr:hypothetical protein [Candidatus Dormibacteraeota bacterium]
MSRRRGAAGAVALVLSALVACSSASPTGSSSPAGAAPTQPLPAATPSATSSTGFPAEAASPGAAADTGFTVWITSSGFRPAILIAPCCGAITWKNKTSASVAVVFDAVAGGSRGAIPPGGIYVFVPHNVESIAYHSGSDPKVTGQVQVNQLAE